ncbi:hypothetical protein BIY29_07350 [Brenneria alni]|uniref:Tail spike TSP1/Gp66 N-terminal domain-containing protein n=1 Tax=Brenneria alni TaxID=71656 RepID=A0A421DQD0_9GAMM|nr:hypothetical protein [Brenneria alni]RLM25320.1 hypothetical protein BIY29_07350 [Brenneria alni]
MSGINGSFEEGGTLNYSYDMLFYESDGNYYRWNGDFNKIVPPGSTPASSGGVGAGAWISVTDVALRANLGLSDGAELIGYHRPDVYDGTVGEYLDKSITYVTPEMFGAVGDGITDDTSAIQSAIEYLKTDSSKYAIIGHRDYVISSSLSVSGFAYGFEMHLRSLRALDSWPDYHDWKTAAPLISIGGTGSMVGLDIRCEYVNGNNRADWINIIGQGCGGSHFHAERLTNVINGLAPKSVTWPSASNHISGGYWDTGAGVAVWLQKGTTGTSPVVEGYIIDVNFVSGFKNGGLLLRNGAQYANVRGQFDFNGRYLSELTMSSNTTSGLTRGDTVTNGTNTAEIIAFYQHPVGTYKLLLSEGHDVSTDGSNFSVDATLTNSNSSWSSTISAVKTPASSNWYPDIIHDFTGSAFGKCAIASPYCGGLVGGLLHSTIFQYGNSTLATTNGINGAQWVHSGTTLSLRDAYRDNYVLDFYEKFMAPYRHLYMRTYRIYGTEVYISLVQSTTKSIRTFSKIGDGTVTNTREVWRVTVSGELEGVGGECLIYVSSSKITIVDNTVTNVTLSVEEFTFKAAQGAQSTMNVIFNFQRIL